MDPAQLRNAICAKHTWRRDGPKQFRQELGLPHESTFTQAHPQTKASAPMQGLSHDETKVDRGIGWRPARGTARRLHPPAPERRIRPLESQAGSSSPSSARSIVQTSLPPPYTMMTDGMSQDGPAFPPELDQTTDHFASNHQFSAPTSPPTSPQIHPSTSP